MSGHEREAGRLEVVSFANQAAYSTPDSSAPSMSAVHASRPDAEAAAVVAEILKLRPELTVQHMVEEAWAHPEDPTFRRNTSESPTA